MVRAESGDVWELFWMVAETCDVQRWRDVSQEFGLAGGLSRGGGRPRLHELNTALKHGKQYGNSMIAQKDHEEAHMESRAMDVEGAISALGALQPSLYDQRRQGYRKLLPAIEGGLDRGVSQTRILTALAENGISLSPATFKKWLNADRKEKESRVVGESKSNSVVSAALSRSRQP